MYFHIWDNTLEIIAKGNKWRVVCWFFWFGIITKRWILCFNVDGKYKFSFDRWDLQ